MFKPAFRDVFKNPFSDLSESIVFNPFKYAQWKFWYDTTRIDSDDHINGKVSRIKNRGRLDGYDLKQTTVPNMPDWTGLFLTNKELYNVLTDENNFNFLSFSYVHVINNSTQDPTTTNQAQGEALNVFTAGTSSVHRENTQRQTRTNAAGSGANASTQKQKNRFYVIGVRYNHLTQNGEFYINGVSDGLFSGAPVSSADIIKLFNSSLATGNVSYHGDFLFTDEDIGDAKMKAVINDEMKKFEWLQVYQGLNKVKLENGQYVKIKGVY